MLNELIEDYDVADTDAQRRAVASTLVKTLSRHVFLDDNIVYPLADEFLSRDGRAVAAQQLRESSEIWRTLSALHAVLGTSTSSDNEAVDRLMTTVSEQVRLHVRTDDNELLREVGDRLDAEDRVELGLVLEQGRHFAGTGRPHATGREHAGRGLAAPVAAAFDRLRERLIGRSVSTRP